MILRVKYPRKLQVKARYICETSRPGRVIWIQGQYHKMEVDVI